MKSFLIIVTVFNVSSKCDVHDELSEKDVIAICWILTFQTRFCMTWRAWTRYSIVRIYSEERNQTAHTTIMPIALPSITALFLGIDNHASVFDVDIVEVLVIRSTARMSALYIDPEICIDLAWREILPLILRLIAIDFEGPCLFVVRSILHKDFELRRSQNLALVLSWKYLRYNMGRQRILTVAAVLCLIRKVDARLLGGWDQAGRMNNWNVPLFTFPFGPIHWAWMTSQ